MPASPDRGAGDHASRTRQVRAKHCEIAILLARDCVERHNQDQGREALDHIEHNHNTRLCRVLGDPASFAVIPSPFVAHSNTTRLAMPSAIQPGNVEPAILAFVLRVIFVESPDQSAETSYPLAAAGGGYTDGPTFTRMISSHSKSAGIAMRHGTARRTSVASRAERKHDGQLHSHISFDSDSAPASMILARRRRLV